MAGVFASGVAVASDAGASVVCRFCGRGRGLVTKTAAGAAWQKAAVSCAAS